MKRAESGAPKSDRRGKRQRQGRDTWTSTPSRVGQLGITGETIEASIVGEGERKERLAKRNQSGTTDKTIEGTLYEAFVRAGAVSQDNSDDPTKVGFSRAARTDAGVHAGGNLVSLKLITSPPALVETDLDIVSHINSFLPPEIRVWDVLRTTNNFNARTSCDSRIYEYLFPSYVLIPPSPKSALGLKLSHRNSESIVSGPNDVGTADPSQPSGSLSISNDAPTSSDSTSLENLDMNQRRRNYRASVADIDRVRRLVRNMEGTHNFYNYTVAHDFRDKSVQRYMIKLEVRDPQVYEGLEWISVHLHGQSFMLHQRKMMGLVMLAARTSTPPNLILETFGPTKIHIPKAPALGLLLEQPRFGVYNLKVGESNSAVRAASENSLGSIKPSAARPSNPSASTTNDLVEAGERPEAERETKPKFSGEESLPGGPTTKEKIDFEKHRDLIDEFKKKYIYSIMWREERAHRVFARWLASVDAYSGTDFDYLNDRGVIPPSAVRKKGVKPEDLFIEGEAEPGEDANAKSDEMDG